jgi:hypothetical protein
VEFECVSQLASRLTVDKNAAYPVAMEALKADETLAAETELRQATNEAGT